MNEKSDAPHPLSLFYSDKGVCKFMSQYRRKNKKACNDSCEPIQPSGPFRILLREISPSQYPGKEKENNKPTGIDIDINPENSSDSPRMSHFYTYSKQARECLLKPCEFFLWRTTHWTGIRSFTLHRKSAYLADMNRLSFHILSTLYTFKCLFVKFGMDFFCF